MKNITTKYRRVWYWEIKSGRKVLAGGYCRTKRDALNDSAITLRDIQSAKP